MSKWLKWVVGVSGIGLPLQRSASQCLLALGAALMTASVAAAESPRASATVAVASNFTYAVKALIADFEGRQPYRIRRVSGSSAKLFAQIQRGAPFDILLSADTAKPRALVTAQLALADSYFVYARGRLVLWSADPALLAVQSQTELLERLRRDDLGKWALANPRLAPYGLAAQQVISRLGLTATLQGKRVVGENVAQALQFVASGNAALGFVARAQLLQLREHQERVGPGSHWLLAETLHQPIEQAGVLLERSRGNAAAAQFFSYLRSPRARDIIREQGYQVP